MLIGGNSRTVAAAADAKIKEINRTLPPGIRARTVLNRTAAGRCHHPTRWRQTSPRARCW